MLRLIEAITARGTEVENTTTEGSLARHTFPAGFWQEGKVVDVSASLHVVDNNSTDTLTPRIRFGASTSPGSNTEIAAGAAVDVVDDDVGLARFTITCRESTDDPSSVELVFAGFITSADATPAIVPFKTIVTAVDTLAATYLDYTAEWSAAHADNEVAADTFEVRELS